MNKFLKHILIYILVVMTLLNCIVPNNVVYATEDTKTEDEEEDPDKFKLPDLTGYHAFKVDSSVGSNAEWWQSGGYLFFNRQILYVTTEARFMELVVTPFPQTEYLDMARNLVSDEHEGFFYGYDAKYLSGLDYLLIPEEDWENLQYVYVSGDQSNYSGPYRSQESGFIIDLGDAKNIEEEIDAGWNTKTTNDNASLFENLITIFLIVLGDGALWAIGAVIGENVTLDSLIFNQYSNTNLAIFKNSKFAQSNTNPFIENGGVLGVLETVYNIFSAIAVAVLLASLLYVALRILLDSTGRKKAKYQEYLVAWLQAVAILFLFPYVMSLMIDVNYALVSDIKSIGSSFISGGDMPSIKQNPFAGLKTTIEFGGQRKASPDNYMEKLRDEAWTTGRAVYAICWLILIGEVVKFFFIYFKRLLMTLFLIAVFPLVTLTYAIDKIGDGRSQAFSNWFKEFTLNVFLQFFHALNYTIVMAIISASKSMISTSNSAMGSANFILILVGITYVANGDNILRGIFGQTGGVGTVKSAADTVFKTAVAVDLAKKASNGIRKTRKRIGGYVDAARGISDDNLRLRENRLNEEDARFRAEPEHRGLPPLDAFEHPLDNDLRDRIDGDVNNLANPSITGSALNTTLDRVEEYMKDPAARHRLYQQLEEKGLSGKDVKDLIEQKHAAGDIEVRNNLEILINRKKGAGRPTLYNKLSDQLLMANGLTDQMLTDKQKADRTVNKFESGINKSNKKTANRRGGRQGAVGGYVGAPGQSEYGDYGAGSDAESGGMNPSGGGNTRSGQIVGSGSFDQSRLAGKTKLKLADPSKLNGQKKGTTAATPYNPTKKVYHDSDSQFSKKKKTSQQKRTKQQISTIRREQMIEKKNQIEGSATVIDKDERRRQHYSYAASRIAEANSGDVTRVEQITAFVDAQRELERAKTDALKTSDVAQKDAAYKAVDAMKEQMQMDKQMEQSMENIQRDAEIMRGKRVVTVQEQNAIYGAAVARETLRVGEGTIEELWAAYHTCVNNGINTVESENIDISALALSVATLNSQEQLRGEGAKQTIDEAISNVKTNLNKGGIYKEIIDNLKYDPNSLKEGERPTELKPVDNDPIQTEKRSVRSIRQKIAERTEERVTAEQRYRDSIYNVNKKSFDADKVREERNRKLIKLSKDIGKEIVRDAAATTGAINAFAAYMAVGDEKQDTTKIISAVTLGGTAGAKLVDTADYYVEEAIDIAKDIRDELNEDREGRNPIKLHGKKK